MHAMTIAPGSTLCRMDSPVGELLLTGQDEVLTGVFVADHVRCPDRAGFPEDDSVLQLARSQLEEYFAGRRRRFDVEIRLAGTPFQRRVWEELERIPFGESISYGELAARVGSPKAVRAVGSANGRNPVSIVIPCHRVIGTTGHVSGYGWGPERKTWLLGHETEVVRRAKQ